MSRRPRGRSRAEEDARGDQHHERVEGDLPEQERPVVGEDLVEQGPAALGDAEALVEPLTPATRSPCGAAVAAPPWPSAGRDGAHARSQNPGPTGWSYPACARRKPSPSIMSGSWGRGRGAGPKTGSTAVSDLEERLVARAQQLRQPLLVEADRAPGVGAQLGVGEVPVGPPLLAPGPGRRCAPGGLEADQHRLAPPTGPARPSGKTVANPPPRGRRLWKRLPSRSTR